ncbi:MAG: DUF1624 domain-containing protein [Firmicutes bacterium]|nr:DUF1624 domain-containing protein [Bacillota bacterium]
MEKVKKYRIWELDFLRGLAILLMVFDHLMFDLKSLPNWFSNFYSVGSPFMEWLYDFASLYWESALRAYGHIVFVAIFLLVSGISFNFSRSNLKRGLKFLAVAIIISVITMTTEVVSGLQIGILFGIIHLFAVGTLLTYLFRKIWNNDVFILALGLIIIGIGFYIEWWKVSYYETITFSRFFEIIIGLKGYGADYFGIIPYTGVIMVGTVLGNLFYSKRVSLLPGLDKKWNRPFVFAGQKSLIIFVTHQLVILTLVYLLGYLLGYRL